MKKLLLQKVFVIITVGFFFLAGCMTLGGKHTVNETQHKNYIKPLMPNVVQVQVKTAQGDDRKGFGVIVGEENRCNEESTLYIVTANHLIRSDEPPIMERIEGDNTSHNQRRRVGVMFYPCRGHKYVPAVPIDFDDEADLAVLAVSAGHCTSVSRMGPGRASETSSWRPRRLSSIPPQTNEPVWFIGRMLKWEIPNKGTVNRIDLSNNRIIFDTQSVYYGTSGAPLIDAESKIVGIILRDRPGSQSEAIAMDLVEMKFETWGLPFDAVVGRKCSSGTMECDPQENALKSGQIRNRFGMRFVPIMAGCFQMGGPVTKPEHSQYNLPYRLACLEKDYLLQQTEVTQCQWEAIMGPNDSPSHFASCGPHCPVESISWREVQAFILRLNQLDGVNTYRLPSEAEWEFACRAGTQTAYPWGKKALCDKMMFANDTHGYDRCLKTYAPANRNSAVRVMSFPLESKRPFELYDMNGNVREWCDDVVKWYGDERTNFSATESGQLRAVRGGGWRSPAAFCRCGARDGLHESEIASSSLGFRLVLVPPGGDPEGK